MYLTIGTSEEKLYKHTYDYHRIKIEFVRKPIDAVRCVDKIVVSMVVLSPD